MIWRDGHFPDLFCRGNLALFFSLLTCDWCLYTWTWTHLSQLLVSTLLFLDNPFSFILKYSCNAGGPGSVPGSGRSPERGHGNPLQYSCVETLRGQRSLAVYRPWGHKKSDMAEWLSTQHSMNITHRWTEEPGRLQSMGLRRVGHDWVTSLSLFTFLHWRKKWQPTPVFLPGESQGRGSLVGCRLWGRTESARLKWLTSSSMIWTSIRRK